MSHPGYDCPYLREHLPWGYSDFAWPGELAALTDPSVRTLIEQRGIRLIQFKDLLP